MSRIAHVLEDFSQITVRPRATDGTLTEEQRLQAFEDGYSAGWADAAKAYSEDRTRADMTIAAAVSDMAFTYQDAQSAMLRALQPFLGQIIDKVLPTLARQSLGLQVQEALMAALANDPPYDAQLSARPDTLEAIRRTLTDPPPMPLRFQADTTLADGQVILRIGSREQDINPDDLLSRINDAVMAFFATEPKEVRHG